MAGLCEGGNEPPGSLKAKQRSSEHFTLGLASLTLRAKTAQLLQRGEQKQVEEIGMRPEAKRAPADCSGETTCLTHVSDKLLPRPQQYKTSAVITELAEVHFMYGKADGNAALARRLYPDRWISRGGPNSWPPRSPDFNSIDFYLRIHL
ncbi:hypothetical protein ANN_12460 [Periplaneta americana]|uniref:Uncharacterized protein n=1 Tax=Periplaneta americana TaxID=6978 RepID=A0ABQ8TIW9_PERAM|nr:hypothetical protein ANN_12460 [Periplaneta americana]